MAITDEQRQRLAKEIGNQLAKASGYSSKKDDVDQWEVAADALVRAIEGIVRAEIEEDQEIEAIGELPNSD
jgi:hypothetical protein